MATVTESTTTDQHAEIDSLNPAQARPHNDMCAASLGHKLAMGTAVVLPLVGCLVGIVLMWQFGWMNWFYLSMLIGGWVITGTGITIGFHRLLSHRAFDTYRPVRAFWMALGALAVQGSPLIWCAIHRRHHELSDLEGDPHSPLEYGSGWWNMFRGFCYSHFGWLFSGHWTAIDLKRYVPDLLKDRILISVDRLYYLWVLASLAIPAAIGGLVTLSWIGVLLGFIWGGLVRVFVVHHITWSINSVCHLWGQREFESSDDSRNNFLFGLLAQGEGWHNNHHAFPTSARQGLRWWQFDLSWLVIRAMQLCRIAWNVRTPSKKAIQAKRL